jgi:diguanylate cyclase (GGDEF)-like protein
MTNELITAIKSLKHTHALMLCYSTLLGVFWLDSLLSAGISTAIFYLVPIWISVVALSQNHSICISVGSAVLWMVSDVNEIDLSNATMLWNATVRMVVFVLLAVLLRQVYQRSAFLETLAYTDELTNLLNRRGFMERFGEELDRARRFRRPFSLAFIDLDNFKYVNDRFGHKAGDDLLKMVSETLVSHTRATDKVGRLGGDEFAVLLVETGQEGVKKAFDKCHRALIDRLKTTGWPVTISAGVLTYTDSDMNLVELVDTADKWMYQVKQNGKNNVIYKLDHELVPVVELD